MVAISSILLFTTTLFVPFQSVSADHLGSTGRRTSLVSRKSPHRNQSLQQRAPGDVKRAHCASQRAAAQANDANSNSTANSQAEEEPKPKVVDVPDVQAKPVRIVRPRSSSTRQRPKTTTTAKPAAQSSAPGSGGTAGGTGGSSGLSSAQVQEFLSLHNDMRRQHGAAPLVWSSTLAEAGKRWADRCVWAHSRGAVGPYGENLAAGTGSAYGVARAMKSWTTDEIDDYDPKNPQGSHYTQVVWKGTKQVGCALAPACNGIFSPEYGPAKYFVCEYLPPGNVIGQFAQNVQ